MVQKFMINQIKKKKNWNYCKNICDILGTEISKEDILDVFRKLDFKAQLKEDKMIVIVPTRRMDISIKEDLIEEVGRIYGVDNIQGKTMILPVKKELMIM